MNSQEDCNIQYTLTFNINFYTKYGENIVVCGNNDTLGN